MRLNNLRLAGMSVLLLFTDSFAIGENAPSAGVPVAWSSPGTEWIVRVRQDKRAWGLGYSDPRMRERAQIPQVAFDFHMRITVLETRMEGATRIARVRFSPLEDAPESLRGESRVLELDASTAKPVTVKERDDEKWGTSSAEFGSDSVLFTETHCFPTDWIINLADVAEIPSRAEEHRVEIETRTDLGLTGEFARFVKMRRPRLTGPDKQEALEVEAQFWSPHDKVPSKQVVQTWVPGEGWWRSYKRYIQGHLDLEATLVEHTGE